MENNKNRRTDEINNKKRKNKKKNSKGNGLRTWVKKRDGN